jgi:ATP-dependent DNA helicase PIF1
MRAVFAVVTSLIFLALGWLLVGGIFWAFGWLLINTGYASGLVILIHALLSSVLSPGFGAALSIASTRSIFRSVPASTIHVGFVSVSTTVTLLLIVNVLHHDRSFVTISISLLQLIAVVLGARLGYHLSEPFDGKPVSKTANTVGIKPPTNEVDIVPSTPSVEWPTPTHPEHVSSPTPEKNAPETQAIAIAPPSSNSAFDHQPTAGLELTNEFRAAVEFVSRRGGNFFVTGRAGTGKSTLLRQLRSRRTGNVVVLAPTGLAAVNVGGQTIHSFFRFKPGLLRPEDIRISRNAAVYRNLDAIIIDEISMVRADLMEAIDHFLRINRGRRREPFGGVQVVLIGDLHQLPPVVDDPEVERYLRDQFGGVYFFNANAFRDSGLNYLELTKIFRQSDPQFTAILDRIAEGRCNSRDLEVLNQNVTSINEIQNSSRFVILAPRNRTVFDLNMQFLHALSGREWEMVATVEGDFDPSSFPTEQSLRLKVGAKVVLLRNDGRKRWVNGTIATIARLGNDRVWISLNGAEYEVEREVWEKTKYEYDEAKRTLVAKSIGSFRQFPLRLAWALTIHKSQGMTLDNTYLDLDGGAFTHGQAYVALSRNRSLSGLRLARPLRASDVIFDPAAVRYRQLCRSISVQ